MLLLVNPHNPTGRAFTRGELMQIAAIAEANDLLVVSDEIHADLTHTPHEHIPFASLGGLVDNPQIRAWMIDQLPMSPSAFDWTMVFFSSLFNGVAAAIRGVVVTVWYFDCRARRDGADLEARLSLAGASWPTGASS